MREYEKQEFDSELFRDRDSAAVFSDIEFRRCYFQGCTLSITFDPALRSTVRNVRLINCSQRGCSLWPAIVEDVLVDGFNTHGQVFQTWAAVFNRVVLQGKIDRVMISNEVLAIGLPRDERQPAIDAFLAANAAYYRRVEWALDISRAEFKELDVRGVPTSLIRRDPETQMVVTREKALEGTWKTLPFKRSLWLTSIDHFLQTNEMSTLLVAGKRNPRFREYLHDLHLLRAAGVTEPD